MAKKRYISNIIKTICIVVVLFGFNIAQSQEKINKYVVVTSSYKPSLSDVNKISLMPVFPDTVNKVIPVSYKLKPLEYNTDNYFVKPIRNAKIIPDPVPKLHKSFFKFGLGNYLTPYLEVNTSNLRSKTYAYSIYFKHHSSLGKVKLDNNEKVHAGLSNTQLKLNGEKYYKKHMLSAHAGITEHSIHYYGYNPVIDTVIDKKDNRQTFLIFNAGTNFKTMYQDSIHLNYDVDLDLNHFRDSYKFYENQILVSGSFNKKDKVKIKNEALTLNTNIDIYQRNNLDTFPEVSKAFVELVPQFQKTAKDWKFRIGANFTYDNINGANFFPKVNFSFEVADRFIVPYIGLDGKVEMNNYSKICLTNPFITPGLNITPTTHKLIAYGGVNLNPVTNLHANFKAKYSLIDDMYLFINDYLTDSLGNQFKVIYDDIDLLDLSGEILYLPVEKLRLLLKGNFYKYSMGNEAFPWHMPKYKLSLTSAYNLKNKILANFDLFAIGERNALDFDGSTVTYDPFIDANIRLEYRYTKKLSAFLNLNNLTATKWYLWHQYPGHRFNILAGLTYSL